MGTPNSELDLELTVDSAPALIHTGRPDGYLDFFNRTWLTYVGRSQEDLQGWTWTSAIHPDDLEDMLRAWRAALATGEPLLHEARVRRADGAFRWMLHHKIALRDEHGNIAKWYGSSIDIEDRRRTEDALRASEERFRALVDHAADAFLLRDESGIVVDVNRQTCDSLGYRRDELIGMRLSEIDPDADLSASWKRFDAGELLITFESRHRRKDGTLFPVEVRTRRFVSSDGRQLALTLARDITERKRAEGAQRESEERYRALIELSPQAVWMTRADGYNIYMNQWWYDYSGLTREESEGFGWARAVHPDERDRAVELWRQAVASGGEWAFETLVRRKDGQYRWHLGRGLPIRDADGNIVRWIGTSVDVHDRREAEETLRRTEAWLSEAQRLSHTGSFAQDLDTGRLVYASPELLRIYGFDPAAGTPSTEAVIRRFHPEDRQRVAEAFERGRENAGHRAEWRIVLPDGSLRYIESLVAPISDAYGRPLELVGTTIDVTERKRAEEALRESELRYRNIFEKVGVAIVEQDFSRVMARLGELKASGVRDFRRYLAEHPELARETLALVGIKDVNEAAVALFGASSKEEFLGALPRLTTREVRAAWASQLLAVAEGRRSVEEVVVTTLRNETIHALVAIVLPPESSGFESVLVTVVDLSERKRAEEALSQAQAALTHVTRVSTVGEVSASIAHELNQPLGAIANNANASLGLLASAKPKLDELRGALGDIVSDAERASAIIERVRGMARRSAPERIPVRLSDLVQEVVGLAAAESATRRVAIRTDVPNDLPLVLGDRVQLQQVLLNLVLNAMDSMSGIDEAKRSLEICGRSDQLDGDPAARVSVQDRGIGLRPEQADQLFEPFYTTKTHGMGLGLAISRSIVEAHRGRLWAEANPGPGATFSFALPVADPAA